EVFARYRELRHQIVEASQMSQARRSRVWMQYNVPMLSHILNRAFEHFCISDQPFDFYIAGRHDNPNPQSVSGHAANFLRHLHSAPETFSPHLSLSDMVSEIVSINLVSWTLRRLQACMAPFLEVATCGEHPLTWKQLVE